MQQKKKVVFLTGATGFIGNHLTKILIENNYFVRCLVRNKNDIGLLRNLPIEIIEGDLFNIDSLENGIKDSDFVIHLAGVVAVKQKNDFYKFNTEATKNILDVIKNINPDLSKFIYISSLSAIGPTKYNYPISENDNPNPITTYGKSKLSAEIYIKSNCENIPFTIIRPSGVYGEGDTATLDFFKLLNIGLFPIMHKISNRVNLIYVNDLVNGIVQALESDNTKGKTYFIASKNNYSWYEISEICKNIFSKKLFIIIFPKYLIYLYASINQIFSLFKKKPSVLNIEKVKDLTAKNWICSIEQAEKDFGFKENTSLEIGFKNTLDWYKNNNWIS